MLILDGGFDLGRRDNIFDLGSGAGAEDDTGVIAPVRRIVMGYTEGRVRHWRQGQEGVGPQIMCTAGV